MMLPTRSMRSAGTPSRRRCSSASGDGVHSRSQIASVTSRLISSGMRRSPLRRPASRCTTGIHSLAPTIAQAAVELTSPTTTIQSGCSRCATFLVGNHDPAGLLGVAPAADLEVEMRRGQAQVPEERIRHVRVVVLARVHDRRTAPRLARQRVVQGRDLHEVGSRGRDQVDVQFAHGLRGWSGSAEFRRSGRQNRGDRHRSGSRRTVPARRDWIGVTLPSPAP